MNFDETLSWVAADLIAEAWHGRPIAPANRQGFFQVYDDNDQLQCKTRWDPGTVMYDGRYFPLPECVCPPWIPCYCKEAPA